MWVQLDMRGPFLYQEPVDLKVGMVVGLEPITTRLTSITVHPRRGAFLLGPAKGALGTPTALATA
jgi:hypothetical protein